MVTQKLVHKPTEDEALAAVRTLIAYIGDDPDRDDLLDTPKRVLDAWRESWGSGFTQDEPEMRMFQRKPYYRSLIVMRNINFTSHCEHHMTPFLGKVSVGYIPNQTNGIVGLSKLARVVDYFSKRLQTQERMTDQIADFLERSISRDIGVVAEASHMCMVSRGVMQPNAMTTTTALRGGLFHDAKAREEFLLKINS